MMLQNVKSKAQNFRWHENRDIVHVRTEQWTSNLTLIQEILRFWLFLSGFRSLAGRNEKIRRVMDNVIHWVERYNCEEKLFAERETATR